MRTTIVFCLLLLMTSSGSAQDWPAYRSDNARSGIARQGIDCPRLEPQWHWRGDMPPAPAWDGPARWDAFAGIRDLPAMRQYDACFHPVSDGSLVYFGSSSQDTLFALDLQNGETRWSFVAGGPIRLAPTIHDGKVYFGCDDGYAYCLDASSGELRWRFSPSVHSGADQHLVINNDRLISFYPVRSGVTVRDGLAYFAASFVPWRESFLCAVNAESGQLDDLYETYVTRHEDATLEGSLLVANDRLIVPQGRIAPLMFNRATGENLGMLPGGGGVTVVLTDAGETVRTEGGGAARAGQIGVFQGKERVASFPRGRAIVVGHNRFFVVDGQKVFAASRMDNDLAWYREMNMPLEIIQCGDYLIVGAEDRVWALNLHDGEPAWSTAVDGRAFGLAVAGERLIVSTDSGHVYAFAATADQPWTSHEEPTEPVLGHSPPVPPAGEPYLDHRWVFHRSAMSGAKGPIVETADLVQVQVADQSGEVPLVLQGSATAVPIGESGQVEAIELKDSYFPIDETAAQKLPNEQITAEAWVRVDQAREWGGIVGCIQDDGATEFGWLLGYRNDKFSFAVAGSESGLTYLTAPTAFQLGTWYHVLGTYDGRTLQLFVDGQRVATSDAEQGPIRYAEQRIFTVGCYRDANENFPLDGALHEVRIYSTAIDDSQVAKLYADKVDQFPVSEKLIIEASPASEISWGPVASYIRPGELEIRYGTKEPLASVVDLVIDDDSTRHAAQGLTTEHRLRLAGLPFRQQLSLRIFDDVSEDRSLLGEYNIDTHFDWATAGSAEADDWAAGIIAASPNTRGIAVVVGQQLADRAKQLAAQTQFSVVLVAENEASANRIRDQWSKETYQQPRGPYYGTKLCVTAAPLRRIPAAFAAVVVAADNSSVVRRLVRPAGGILHDGDKVVWTRDPLKGSGIWSHMYGTADNSAFGGEQLSDVSTREDLMVQWIGRPGPRYQTDRQNRKPSPLAAGGRIYLQGQQRIISLDSFSGSVLWSLETPTVMRWNVPHDCSNWCADESGVYVAAEGEAWYFDGKSGELSKRYKLPDRQSDENLSWGYMARYGEHLIGTAVNPAAIYTDWWGSSNWFDSTEGADTHVVAGDKLFALDKETGDKAWDYVGLVLHPTITIFDDRIYFVQSNSAEHQRDENRRIALDQGQDLVLVCLSIANGEPIWQRSLPSFAGRVAALYLAAGGDPDHPLLVMSASESSLQHFALQTFDPESGNPAWSRTVAWESNHHGKHIMRPAIQGELVYLRPEVLNIETGETIVRGFPSGHGCGSYALSTVGLFTRLGETTWWDPRNEKVHRFDRLRTDCWISVVPAQGMLISAEGGGGCSCGSWLETSLGFMPRSITERLPDESDGSREDPSNR